MKMIFRINPLIILIFSLPGFILGYFSLKKIYESSLPPYFMREDSYVFCSDFGGCKSFPKEIIDSKDESNADGSYKDMVDAQLRDEFKLKVEQSIRMNNTNAASGRRDAFFALVYFGFAFYYWYINKIEISDGILNIRSYWAFPSRMFSKPPIYDVTYSKSSRRKRIEIKSIKNIQFLNITPLIPERTNIDQLNWRDRVLITYKTDEGKEDLAVVELFSFPGFKEGVVKILNNNPDIKYSFSKSTAEDNLKEGFGL